LFKTHKTIGPSKCFGVTLVSQICAIYSKINTKSTWGETIN
jgi:hypothetical protein